VNGAGKSSIGGKFVTTSGNFFYNPDTIAAQIRTLHPDISNELANGHAWQIGKSLLEAAIHSQRDYRFETTLGGRTITALLENASRSGHRLHVWFCPEIAIGTRAMENIGQESHPMSSRGCFGSCSPWSLAEALRLRRIAWRQVRFSKFGFPPA